MRLTLVFAGVLAALLIGFGTGWATGLAAIPYVATDRLWSRFISKGSQINILSPTIVRDARRNSVPRDNADTLTRSAIIDLAEGPQVFEAEVPTEAEYWSVSLFAHNTDTFFVANDTRTGRGPFRLLIRRPGQTVPEEGFDAVAVSPTRKSFLIIRAVMTDRNDAAAVARLDAQVKNATLEPLGPGAD
jgi:hypothetical protein